ncbi:MAG: hypothetical protein U0931_12900 [Vulcanimicrobiota bacterium]
MRPLGSLHRPQSRFQRPRRSWLRRVFQAGQLRLSFSLVYLLVAGLAVWQIYGAARSYGYFYFEKERQQLWQKFPDRAACLTLSLIYEHQADRPEMQLITYALGPSRPDPRFSEWLQDPRFKNQALVARQMNFEARLEQLKQSWRFSLFEELLSLSQDGQLLGPEQRLKLDLCRQDQLAFFLTAQPDSEQRVQTYLYRLTGELRRPWPLSAGWRQLNLDKARQNERQLIEVAATIGANPLPALRRMQLLVRMAGVERGLAPRLKALGQEAVDQCAAEPTEDHLRIVAHYKKLAPGLELGHLLPRLNAAQRTLLNCLEDLTANPA